MLRFNYYKLKFLFAIFMAFWSVLRALPFFSRFRVSLLNTRVLYVRHRADIDYSIKCKISVKWAKQSNEVEAASVSEKRLKRNQELNTQFRINKTNIYFKNEK